MIYELPNVVYLSTKVFKKGAPRNLEEMLLIVANVVYWFVHIITYDCLNQWQECNWNFPLLNDFCCCLAFWEIVILNRDTIACLMFVSSRINSYFNLLSETLNLARLIKRWLIGDQKKSRKWCGKLFVRWKVKLNEWFCLSNNVCK